MTATHKTLRAVSDLHISYEENRALTESIRPAHPEDWLIVAGDVGERLADIEWALRLLAGRFARVVWAPGNHELWTLPGEPDQARGVARYERLVALCRDLGVLTPEDPWPVWDGPGGGPDGSGGPLRIAPLFTLYDYSWYAPGTTSPEASLARAHEAGIVCTDEAVLYHEPYAGRAAWCADRVAYTEKRLAEAAGGPPLVLVNHWPLVRRPTEIMTHQEFVQWCGTERTADWHTRFDVRAVVYGHLHIPRSARYDGVPFEEVSLGYPREWKRFGRRADLARPVFPEVAP